MLQHIATATYRYRYTLLLQPMTTRYLVVRATATAAFVINHAWLAISLHWRAETCQKHTHAVKISPVW